MAIENVTAIWAVGLASAVAVGIKFCFEHSGKEVTAKKGIARGAVNAAGEWARIRVAEDCTDYPENNIGFTSIEPSHPAEGAACSCAEDAPGPDY